MANELLESFFTSVTSLKFSNFLFLFNYAGISTLLIPAVWRLNIIYKLNDRPVISRVQHSEAESKRSVA